MYRQYSFKARCDSVFCFLFLLFSTFINNYRYGLCRILNRYIHTRVSVDSHEEACCIIVTYLSLYYIRLQYIFPCLFYLNVCILLVFPFVTYTASVHMNFLILIKYAKEMYLHIRPCFYFINFAYCIMHCAF